MSKCPNCGAKVDEDALFCEECGADIPQVKKCINCGAEISLTAKFCKKCRAPQNVGDSGTSVNIGDKNVVAGDVVGQKVAGDNVQTKIMGNAFFSTVLDEPENNCYVCGKRLRKYNGHTCPGCGNVVCEEHFDLVKNLCLKCIAAEKEKNAAKYKDALQSALADGFIDVKERALLKSLQIQLGISDNDAESWERNAKLSRMQSADLWTEFENINIKNSVELFYEKGDVEEAYKLVEPIYKSHPYDEQVLNLYFSILVQYDIALAKQTVQSIKVDCLALYIAEIEIALYENRLDYVEKKIHQGRMLSPENEMLKYYTALLYVRLAFESGEDRYFDNAKNVADSFVGSANKVVQTLQAKMRKVLSVLCGLPYSVDEGRTLYKALYLQNIGINEIPVGPNKLIKSIQQAIDVVDVDGTIFVDEGMYKEHLEFSKSVKLVGLRSSILNKSSKSLPIIVLDSDKTCKLLKSVEIEGVVFTHNADISFDNLNEYARNERRFEDGYFYFDFDKNSLLCVESDSVLSNVGILDSNYYGITFSKNNAKVMNSVVSRCYKDCVYCIGNSHAVISYSMISRSNGFGICVADKSKPVITSCEIFGHLCDGVREEDSASGTFSNCYVHDNLRSGFVVSGESAPKIENCKIYDNKTEGKKYLGIRVGDNSKPIVTGCEIFGHLSSGIFEKGNACGTYSDCNVYGNGGSGVGVQDSASGSFKNCYVHDNKGNGFNINGESTPKIEKCKIHDNKGNGFNISGESKPKIENCKIHDNKTEGEKKPGVVVKEKSKPTITDCEIFGHLSYGIWEKDTASGTYSDCNVYGNSGSGVGVQDSASGSFKNCHIHENKANGFYISGESTPKIEKCKIHDNKTEGEKYPGIVTQEKSKPVITDCEIFGHLSYGIWEKDNARGSYERCYIHDNTGIDICREH